MTTRSVTARAIAAGIIVALASGSVAVSAQTLALSSANRRRELHGAPCRACRGRARSDRRRGSVASRWPTAAPVATVELSKSYDFLWHTFRADSKGTAGPAETPVGEAVSRAEPQVSVPAGAWGAADSHGDRYAIAAIGAIDARFRPGASRCA